MEITDRAEYDEHKLKAVDSIVKDGVSAQSDSMKLAWLSPVQNLLNDHPLIHRILYTLDDSMKLAWWIRENYGSTMIAALKTVLPVKKKLKQVVRKTIVCKVDTETAAARAEGHPMNQIGPADICPEIMQNAVHNRLLALRELFFLPAIHLVTGCP